MKKILLLVAFISLVSFANAQYIIAGQHGTNDYYHQYNPDTIVRQALSGPSPYIDINNDGVNDFMLTLYPGTGALGWVEYYTVISGLHGNKIVLETYDTCYYASTQFVRIGIAHPFYYNDTIDAAANWSTSTYLHFFSNTGQNPVYFCNYSYSPDTAYIGLQVIKGTQTLYGWLKIVSFNCSYGASSSITISAYACNKDLTGILKFDENNNALNISPNPATSEINVIGNQSTDVGIEIYNMLGERIYFSPITDNRSLITINISSFPTGMYFLEEIKSEKGISTKKFIKE